MSIYNLGSGTDQSCVLCSTQGYGYFYNPYTLEPSSNPNQYSLAVEAWVKMIWLCEFIWCKVSKAYSTWSPKAPGGIAFHG